MEPIKNIIFDFDGTLADTATVIVATMTRTFQDMGLPFETAHSAQKTSSQLSAKGICFLYDIKKR